MTSNVLCKYYMNGACAYGDQCRFSHNKQDEPTQVCKFYLQGNCAYGERCRYHHSKPQWSGRGQPAPPSNYNAPTGVFKPAAGPAPAPPGAAAAAAPQGGAPNWDDFMTPDEMDEFEQWQEEQQMASPTKGGGAGEGDEGDIVDPADIPLCQEFAATGQCSAGDECLYIHGEECEICGYYCAHPYNPDWTAQHQAACREHLAAAAAAANGMPNGYHHHQQQQHHHTVPPPPPPPSRTQAAAAQAADLGGDQRAMSVETPNDVHTAAAAAADGSSSSNDAVKATVAAAVAAVVAEEKHEQQEGAVGDVTDKLAGTQIQ